MKVDFSLSASLSEDIRMPLKTRDILKSMGFEDFTLKTSELLVKEICSLERYLYRQPYQGWSKDPRKEGTDFSSPRCFGMTLYEYLVYRAGARNAGGLCLPFSKSDVQDDVSRSNIKSPN